VEALGSEEYPVVELADRLEMDWTVVLAVLEELVVAGRVDAFVAPGQRTNYRVAGVVDRTADDGAGF
jgi:hypothetical protein